MDIGQLNQDNALSTSYSIAQDSVNKSHINNVPVMEDSKQLLRMAFILKFFLVGIVTFLFRSVSYIRDVSKEYLTIKLKEYGTNISSHFRLRGSSRSNHSHNIRSFNQQRQQALPSSQKGNRIQLRHRC